MPVRSTVLRRVLLVLAAALTPLTAYAQDADTTRWVTDVVGQLTGSQAGFQNWQEGGINTLATSAVLTGQAQQNADRWVNTYESKLAFGLIKQDDNGLRKAEDQINLRAAFKYRGDGFFQLFRPTLGLALRTQFAKGFNYDKNPYADGGPVPVAVSAFLAPATITQSLGLTYAPNEWFRQRVGVGLKETLIRIERFRPLYGLRLDQGLRFEAGLDSFTEVDKEIAKNVRLQSKLGLFAAFNQPDKPDLLWENLVQMKVNSWLSVNFEFVSLFDRDISDAVQLKEVLAVGISFVLI